METPHSNGESDDVFERRLEETLTRYNDLRDKAAHHDPNAQGELDALAVKLAALERACPLHGLRYRDECARIFGSRRLPQC